jgi:MFS family permease
VCGLLLRLGGASAAYLTVSEIFPMETRALCIAVFYAIGTGIGRVIGPQVFGRMINTGSYEQASSRSGWAR